MFNIQNLEEHRSAIAGHCYRMLGSFCDAEDATQEAIVRAWRSLDRFDERSSLRTWLYRIATNVCLDEIKGRNRRARPMEEGAPSSATPRVEDLIQLPEHHWLEPIADSCALPTDADPFQRAILKQSIRLAFVAALQKLAPRQRAVLLLMEVLGFSAKETAETLETSVASVNSALQRARAALANREHHEPAELTFAQKEMLTRYMVAFENYDVDALTSLLRDDASFCMPPYSLWLQGPDAVRTWMLGMGSGCRGSRLIPTLASGWPAFAQYRVNPEGGHKAWALIVLELDGERIAGVNSFLDTEKLFPRFNHPLCLSV